MTSKKVFPSLVFYSKKTMTISPSTPEVTECIKIDKELHVKLFFKDCPVPLPQWFRQGTDCRLTKKAC